MSSSKQRRAGIETADERLEHLLKALREAKDYKRKAEERQAQIVGKAIIKAMSNDAVLKKSVMIILRRDVTGPSDRADIAPLLIENPAQNALKTLPDMPEVTNNDKT